MTGFSFIKNFKPKPALPTFITLAELAKKIPGASYEKLKEIGVETGLVSKPGRTLIVAVSNVQALVEACKCSGSGNTKTASSISGGQPKKGQSPYLKAQALLASKSKKPKITSKKGALI
jgi:hypothetical protein